MNDQYYDQRLGFVNTPSAPSQGSDFWEGFVDGFCGATRGMGRLAGSAVGLVGTAKGMANIVKIIRK